MPKTLEELLATAFTQIAQKACRNGEQEIREWPPLSDLPERSSWAMVGKQYAKQFIQEMRLRKVSSWIHWIDSRVATASRRGQSELTIKLPFSVKEPLAKRLQNHYNTHNFDVIRTLANGSSKDGYWSMHLSWDSPMQK
jgi:hypothetical protein